MYRCMYVSSEKGMSETVCICMYVGMLAAPETDATHNVCICMHRCMYVSSEKGMSDTVCIVCIYMHLCLRQI
jgi:hypothetical protein